MSSEIGDKALLKRVADSLKILDTKQMAALLKTDEVIPVIDLSRYISTSPVNPPTADQWTYATYGVTIDLVTNDVQGSAAIMPDFQQPGRLVRCLDISFRVKLEVDMPLADDPTFGFRVFYPSDEYTQNVIHIPVFDRLSGAEGDITYAWFALHGTVIHQRSPAAEGPAVPLACTWDGLIRPDKQLNLEWFLSSALDPGMSGPPLCTIDVVATYVYGDETLGVPPR